jgi:hypothetical protein
MLNQGNLIPPAGGKDLKRYSSSGKDQPRYASGGEPTTEAMGDEGLSLPFPGKSKAPFQLNIRSIRDGVGPKPDPRKGTMLPESDDALDQFTPIERANLSQGAFTHEQNIEIPWEGFNDPANLKV